MLVPTYQEAFHQALLSTFGYKNYMYVKYIYTYIYMYFTFQV